MKTKNLNTPSNAVKYRKIMEQFETEFKRLQECVKESIRKERLNEPPPASSGQLNDQPGPVRGSRRPGSARNMAITDDGSGATAEGDVESGGQMRASQQRLAKQQFDMTRFHILFLVELLFSCSRSVSVETQNIIERERLDELQRLEADFHGSLSPTHLFHECSFHSIELAELFEDMHAEVLNQGQDVQRISDNVQMGVKDTDRGVFELNEARTYQQKSRKKMCIVLCCVGIIVIVGA